MRWLRRVLKFSSMEEHKKDLKEGEAPWGFLQNVAFIPVFNIVHRTLCFRAASRDTGRQKRRHILASVEANLSLL